MRPDDPRHGSTKGATAHYREGSALCDPCREARNIANRRNKKNARRGWTGYVPIAKTRRRIHALQQLGYSYQRISDLSGVSIGSISRIANGQVGRVLTRNAAKIQAIDLVPADTHLVPAFRVQRRLQALQAIGWSLVAIAERTGWSTQNLNGLMSPWRERDEVTRETFDLIDAAYRSMAMRPPTESKWTKATRTRAARKGWVSPLAWDDIDDPNEVHPAPCPKCGRTAFARGLCRNHYYESRAAA
jgi:hypothetical protein